MLAVDAVADVHDQPHRVGGIALLCPIARYGNELDAMGDGQLSRQVREEYERAFENADEDQLPGTGVGLINLSSEMVYPITYLLFRKEYRWCIHAVDGSASGSGNLGVLCPWPLAAVVTGGHREQWMVKRLGASSGAVAIQSSRNGPIRSHPIVKREEVSAADRTRVILLSQVVVIVALLVLRSILRSRAATD